MNKTYRAVMGAFHSGMFPKLRNVSFASEPESWALYTIQHLLQTGHNVLIPVTILCARYRLLITNDEYRENASYFVMLVAEPS